MPNLNSQQRNNYLQAMGIVQWIPRQSLMIEAPTIETPTIEALEQLEELAEMTAPAIQVAQKPEALQETQVSKHAETQIADEMLAEKTCVSEVHVNEAPETIAIEEKTAQHYLKMVPWSSGSAHQAGLLIICRHDKEQPAQSFARASSPSQFMNDYIQALISLLDESSEDSFIRMGHLSQAGLGKDCVPLEQVCEQIKPKLVLLLGDETLKEMLTEEASIATFRGQRITLANLGHGIVSYHPYSLIKNPALKPLALEDLKMVASLLAQ